MVFRSHAATCTGTHTVREPQRTIVEFMIIVQTGVRLGGLRKEGRGCITACPIFRKGTVHRVGRVLCFFSSRRYWDSPNPSPAGECAPPPLVPGGGAHSLAREGVGRVPIPTRGITLWYSLYSVYVLCGTVLAKKKGSARKREREWKKERKEKGRRKWQRDFRNENNDQEQGRREAEVISEVRKRK
jgi:hypothetical protein